MTERVSSSAIQVKTLNKDSTENWFTLQEWREWQEFNAQLHTFRRQVYPGSWLD